MNRTFTIHLGNYFGMHVERMKGSDDKWYLSFVLWIPRNRRQLRHIYAACRTI